LFFAWVVSIIISLVFNWKQKYINLFIAIMLMFLWLFFPFIWEKMWFQNKSININIIEEKIRKLDFILEKIEYENKKK
jgi:hypothetical protein